MKNQSLVGWALCLPTLSYNDEYYSPSKDYKILRVFLVDKEVAEEWLKEKRLKWVKQNRNELRLIKLNKEASQIALDLLQMRTHLPFSLSELELRFYWDPKSIEEIKALQDEDLFKILSYADVLPFLKEVTIYQ